MNNLQKVINQITKNSMKLYSKPGFLKTRIIIRKDNKDLDFHTLVIYKNLG